MTRLGMTPEGSPLASPGLSQLHSQLRLSEEQQPHSQAAPNSGFLRRFYKQVKICPSLVLPHPFHSPTPARRPVSLHSITSPTLQPRHKRSRLPTFTHQRRVSKPPKRFLDPSPRTTLLLLKSLMGDMREPTSALINSSLTRHFICHLLVSLCWPLITQKAISTILGTAF